MIGLQGFEYQKLSLENCQTDNFYKKKVETDTLPVVPTGIKDIESYQEHKKSSFLENIFQPEI